MFWAEKKGKVKKGTAKRWAEETPDIKNLPERVFGARKKRKSGKKKKPNVKDVRGDGKKHLKKVSGKTTD